ncbi:alpha/beta fold hydrolase [Variovorax beijingensis]|uniref:alpha/beta fold hydrolase n=1 Tax=Variovorax beijingensis TaxID=2496117 RepID=UPI001CB9CA25|nr:hypothetical protein [Variovorax beijingensis]
MARESTLSIEGLTLSYRCAGDPRSPWLILLHGWPQSKSIYDPVLGELGRDAHAPASGTSRFTRYRSSCPNCW